MKNKRDKPTWFITIYNACLVCDIIINYQVFRNTVLQKQNYNVFSIIINGFNFKVVEKNNIFIVLCTKY